MCLHLSCPFNYLLLYYLLFFDTLCQTAGSLGLNKLLLNCPYYMQAVPQRNKEVSDGGPGGRRPDISLQVPPRPTGFGSTSGVRVLDHSQSFGKGISSSRGFLRALSLKRKGNVADGERSSLLNSDPKTAADGPNMASISEIAWKRCTSLPVTPASNLSPSVSTPISARTYNEQTKPHVSYLLLH